MHIRPILVALRKHKLATFLIAMEIALACAVLCNAVFIIANRLSAMHIVTGVDEASLGEIVVTGFDPKEASDLNARMIAGLAAIPGVESVHAISSVPFGPQAGTAGVTLDHKNYGTVIDYYMGDPGTIKALGLQLVAGSMPDTDDYQAIPDKAWLPPSARVLVSRALADQLWPGESPLGKMFWTGPYQYRVIGVVANFMGAGANGGGRAEWSAFVPALPGGTLAGTYLIRANPQDLERVMTEARNAVATIAPHVVLDRENSQSIPVLRSANFATDRAMAGMLIGVIVALLGVTALGIVGLASFWVAQRRKQIGIRRAIGATRGDILRYFQTENFLIVTLGIAIGMLLAFVLNAALMKFYELPHLPLYYLPVGALALWGLGQLAVLGPALRAAAVPPVVATRSV
ncbi:ABC transporter permease [Rhodanobacter sp. Si-c]|uniref:ABC transporter permease n=1 Tax=Rhodanobacter lycopersici TaxID=3162487 RepID=A0ABV3QBM7_9GAMM